jgi:hypothetical protein
MLECPPSPFFSSSASSLEVSNINGFPSGAVFNHSSNPIFSNNFGSNLNLNIEAGPSNVLNNSFINNYNLNTPIGNVSDNLNLNTDNNDVVKVKRILFSDSHYLDIVNTSSSDGTMHSISSNETMHTVSSVSSSDAVDISSNEN